MIQRRVIRQVRTNTIMLDEKSIIFCNPPISLKRLYGILESGGAFAPPLNLLSLAAQTRVHGYTTKIIDCAAEKLDYKISARKIVDFKCKYIGITATTVSINDAVYLAREIKAISREAIVIIGGVHITALPFETMQANPEFDIGVYGEGEITIINVLDALSEKKELAKVKGILFRKQNGEVVKNEKQPLIEDLDSLPLPAWDLLEGFATRYAPTTSRMTALPSIYINSSRGCPYKCVFCDRSVLGNKFREFSPDRMIDMFKRAKEMFKVKNITIYDENMTLSKERLVDLCSKIIKNKLHITWSCDMRADFIVRNLDVLKLMYKSGCRSINFGVESGNQKVLDFYKKGERLEDIDSALQLTHEAGISTTGFFIIGGPTETVETINDTIRFASRLKLDYAVPFYFTPFPGSAIYKDISKFGIYTEDWDQSSSLTPLFIPRDLTKKTLERLYLAFIIKFYFTPKRAIQIISRNMNLRSLARLFTTGIGIIPGLVARFFKLVFTR